MKKNNNNKHALHVQLFSIDLNYALKWFIVDSQKYRVEYLPFISLRIGR